MDAGLKTISVQYFAQLREQRGVRGETVETYAETPLDLFQEIARKIRFSLPQEQLKVSVNETFCGWDTKLKAGDRVAFLPPVAGG